MTSGPKTHLRAFRSYLLRVLLPIGTIVLLVNQFVPAPFPEDPRKRADLTLNAGDVKSAEDQFLRLLHSDSLNVELNRAAINAHFDRPKGKNDRQREDTTIVRRYRAYASSADPAARDVGNYCLGLSELRQNRFSSGFSYLDRVADSKLPFLNNTKGYALLRMGRPDLAEGFFMRELEFGTNTEGAVTNLARRYFEKRDFRNLADLGRNPAWAQAFMTWREAPG